MNQLLLRGIRLIRHNLLPYMGQKESTGIAQVLSIQEIQYSGIGGGDGWMMGSSPYPYIGTRVTFKVEHLYVGSLTINGTCTAFAQGDTVKVFFKKHCNEEIKKVLIIAAEVTSPLTNCGTTQNAKE